MANSEKESVEMQRIAGGDVDAFTRIYNRYRDKVYGFAYRMSGVQAIAEEITHEAFLVLIKQPERYEAQKGSVLTFLCAVTRNCILNHFRRREYLEDSYEDHLPVLASVEDDMNPLSSLLEQELTILINESIALLPPLQREVVILREFQELSYEEIAVVTGIDTNVVKARLHRGRQNLAKYLAPYMDLNGERSYEMRRG